MKHQLIKIIDTLQDCGAVKDGGVIIKSCSNKQLAETLLANRVLVLPCALGEKVWCLIQPCGGCECYNEPMKEEFIEQCRTCDKWEIGECEFDYELIPEWGEYVFPTKEQAEEALVNYGSSKTEGNG